MIRSGSISPGIDPAQWHLPAGTALRYEQPAEALRRLVPSYAVLDSNPAAWSGPDSWVLPGAAQIWIVLTHGTITVRTRRRELAALGAAMLYGPSSRAMPVTSQGGVSVVVDLSAAGWARLIDRPARAVRDQLLPLDRFWPADRVQALIARLHDSDRGETVKPILDDFFAATLPPPHRDEEEVDRLAALVAQPEMPAIGEAAAAMGLSSGTLLRVANRHFGFPPKMLARRTRFLRVITAMMTDASAATAGAPPAGYHDVPHFLRDADEFLGLTARRFLALPMPYLRSVLLARTQVIGAPLPVLDAA